jgi:transposase InsO family protein
MPGRIACAWEVPSQLREVLRPPLEFAQYTSEAHEKLLAAHDVLQSVTRPGNCYDNAVAESFFSTLKHDLVYRNTWATRGDAKHAIFEYIEAFYNRERRHSLLGHVSPDTFEARYRMAQVA